MGTRASKRAREEDGQATSGSACVRSRLDDAAVQTRSTPAPIAPPPALVSSPIDALPDELLLRILLLAARREWRSQPACGGISQLDPRENAPDARPELLQLYRGVCRRFRSVCGDPSAWERVALRKPCPDDLEALLRAPKVARRGARRVQVCSSASNPAAEALGRLRECFPGPLSELELWLDLTDPESEARPRLGIPPLELAAFSELRSLSLRVSEGSFASFGSPFGFRFSMFPFLGSFPLLQTLDLSGLPITIEDLERMRGLAIAPTLRALSFDLHIAPPLAVRKTPHVTLNLRSEADTAPLAALAPTLRSLVLVQARPVYPPFPRPVVESCTPQNATDPAALCSVLRRLSRLQARARFSTPARALDLSVPRQCVEQLAAEPLTWCPLPALRGSAPPSLPPPPLCSPATPSGTIANAFLWNSCSGWGPTRAGKLRRLTVRSPLPSDPALLASAFGLPRWAGLRALILSDAAKEQARFFAPSPQL
eukprot:tig00000113_g5656.t1